MVTILKHKLGGTLLGTQAAPAQGVGRNVIRTDDRASSATVWRIGFHDKDTVLDKFND